MIIWTLGSYFTAVFNFIILTVNICRNLQFNLLDFHAATKIHNSISFYEQF